MSPTTPGTLDKIISVSGKIQQIVGILVPGLIGASGLSGAAGIGVVIAKFLAEQWNENHADNPVVLPPDPELIQRLAATSTRVVGTGVDFLDGE